MNIISNENQSYVCYLDILGFKSRLKNIEFEKFYNDLIDFISNEIAPSKDVFLCVFSDGIVIVSKIIENVINVAFAIYSEALKWGILIRGALTKGVIYPFEMRKIGDNIVLPYLGAGFIEAYEMEKSVNCAAICVHDNIVTELGQAIEGYIFKYRELFPTDKQNGDKYFLVSDIYNNFSVPLTILLKMKEEIPKVPNQHDFHKFIDTFLLYVKALKHKGIDISQFRDYCLQIIENVIEDKGSKDLL
ncbi:MAG: hypothetical protein OEZ31_10710 [Nitrospirota bacterium]|nr:hypothetical protein [Flavobacteriaceae bacterium]MDH5769407.1 hypothetical protein [Nitrospirota bacterium]